MPTRNWQRDLDDASVVRAALNQQPQPFIDVNEFVETFLSQRGNEFTNGIQAAAAIIPVAQQKLADLGYAPRPMNWLRLELATITGWNRRELAAAAETKRERAEWICDFQAGAR